MSLTEQQIQDAEQYLDGKLSVEKLKLFENVLKSNQELNDYVVVNKEMRLQYSSKDWAFQDSFNEDDISKLEEYFKSNDALNLKSTIKNTSKQYHNGSKKQSVIKKLYPYMAIAASIVLLLGYFIINNNSTTLELYNQNNNWSNLPSLTSRSNDDNTLLVKGEKAFLDKDYNKAKKEFSTFVTNAKEINPTALLYLGVSQLELNEEVLALETFQKLIESNTIDQSKGYWYKALTYLKIDDKDNAIKQLELILSNTENYNYNQAKVLLEELK